MSGETEVVAGQAETKSKTDPGKTEVVTGEAEPEVAMGESGLKTVSGEIEVARCEAESMKVDKERWTLTRNGVGGEISTAFSATRVSTGCRKYDSALASP